MEIFQSKNFSFSLKNYYKGKKKRNHPLILIVLPQEDIVLHRYIILFCDELLCWMFFIYLFIYFAKSICDRDLFGEWIYDHAYSKEILEVIQKFCWLLNASTISDKLKGRINDIYEKNVPLTKK